MTDRRTDRQTDGRPGKNNMSPDPKGGRHNEGARVVTLLSINFEDDQGKLTP